MKIPLYYFSGTGNSLEIAKDLADKLGECELVPIAKIWQKNHLASASEKVGIIFPLYYWGLPKIVYDFINKIELEKTNYFFAVVTRGGDVDGAPLLQLDEILRNKSKALSAGFFITMPDNYVLLSDAICEEEQTEMFEKAKNQIDNISEIVKQNKQNFEIAINEKERIKFEKMNKKFHKTVNESDKSFFADENCNSCGVCENVCPVNNIILVEGKPKWQHECQQCLACINFCPENSIQYGDKTQGRKRYHHPNITVNDLINQKV